MLKNSSMLITVGLIWQCIRPMTLKYNPSHDLFYKSDKMKP